MNTQTVANTARQSSDELLQSAGKAVDTTRSYANDALDKAENKVRELRGSVDPVVDMLTSKAQHLARQSLEIASEAKHRANSHCRTLHVPPHVMFLNNPCARC